MTNLDIVKALYDAFSRGDIPAALSLMAPDIEWHEAENNKLAEGNPYVGPQAVLEGVFMRLGEDIDDFAVHPERFVADDDQVVMAGRYGGTSKATGEPVTPQVVHWWTVRGGKLSAFQQHLDTLAWARGCGDL